jgi:hypothetical protein
MFFYWIKIIHKNSGLAISQIICNVWEFSKPHAVHLFWNHFYNVSVTRVTIHFAYIWLLFSRNRQDMRWSCRKQWHFSFCVNSWWGKAFITTVSKRNKNVLCAFSTIEKFSFTCYLFYLLKYLVRTFLILWYIQSVLRTYLLVRSLWSCMPILNCLRN